MSRPEDIIKHVLNRDRGKCVLCGEPGTDLYDLLDSRLWEEGLSPAGNVVLLCEKHKRQAERDEIEVNTIREKAGIERCYPLQFYSWLEYDRWGNSLYSDGRRAKGDLFDEADVRQALTESGKIDLFGAWARYPRTFVLPWSDVTTAGDHKMRSADIFEGRRVVATEKLDGQNVTLYRDSFVFKSAWPRTHPSKEWMHAFWEERKTRIPDGWRVCGEFLYLTHTVQYRDLDSYFVGFSVWDSTNTCLAWDATSSFFEELDIACAPILFDGEFDREAIDRSWRERGKPKSEGYVLRLADAISYKDFRRHVGKFIRAGFVQSDFSKKTESLQNKMRSQSSETPHRG